MFVDPFDSVVEIGFVVAIEVGDVDFEPAQTAFAEFFGFAECEEASAEVVADVVEMCGYGVCSTAEVEVVREVERVIKKLKVIHQQPHSKRRGKPRTALAISNL